MSFFSGKTNKLLIPFIIMTFSIIVLSVASQLLINTSLYEIKSDANLVTILGKQKVLSQEIVSGIAADNLLGKITGEPMDKLETAFAHGQSVLLKGDAALKLQPLDPNFLQEYQKLEKQYSDFTASMNHAILSENNNAEFVDLMNKQDTYSNTVDHFISTLNGYSSDKINKFQFTQMLILIASLTIILLEVVFIFFPAINKIQKQNEQFKKIAYNQCHVVRQPVANLKSLLHLTNYVKEDKDVKELIDLAHVEADKLDTIIQKNVSHTSTSLF